MNNASVSEPTVNMEENELLQASLKLAETDRRGAIQMLHSIKDPEQASAAIDFAIGSLYFQEDRLEKAETAYAAALKKMPTFRRCIKNLGRVYLLRDKLDEAIALYQQLIADGQADADILLLTGHALLTQGYPVSAESAYRQALLLQQKSPDALLGLAKALIQQARYSEGLALVGEILREDPVNRELWALRANAYLTTGDYDAAVRTVEAADRLGCADMDMLATLGDLYLNRDQPLDAMRVYQKAFQDGSLSAVRLLRAIEGFLMLDKLAQAEKMMDRAESAHDIMAPDEQVKLLRLKADMAIRQERPDNAERLCREILTIDPLDGETLLLLANVQQGAGHLEEAVLSCEQARRLPGFEVDALIRQARIEVSRERYPAAISLLEAAQTLKDQAYVGRYLEQLRRMVD